MINIEEISLSPVPRLAMMNDLAGFGRCSTVISLPVISALQVQVCPIPTSILSNHLGFPTCYFDDYTSHIREYLMGWEKLGISFDGFYCGFLGSVEQFDMVEELLLSPLLSPKGNDKTSLFLLDPVMGDHGKPYSTITPEHCRRMKALAEKADILTPNITEACLLTDTEYRESGWTDYELEGICRTLAYKHKASTDQENTREKCIVITGLQHQTSLLNYIWVNGRRSTCITPVTGNSRPGTGDLFASILVADALNRVPFTESVRKAADFVSLCIQGAQQSGLPIQEGVPFERYLSVLMDL